LQHSHSKTGDKELTDINALADEYLRLSFHGLRAKDKNFQSDFSIDADPAVGQINIVRQDISRVLLNIINNAFYAVHDKAQKSGESYKPLVSVRTKKETNKVVITIEDNGDGIPENIIHKIFQPFFTTKPTGQGTGLGLSMSYDIVKSQGGDIQVNSEPGMGTTFTIQLPV
jgi:two-component system, NtrC family, sensor kinase